MTQKKGGIKRFLKVQAATQIATFCDFAITYFLLQVLGIYYLTSTTLGAISGGLINCLINYKWAFSSNNLRMRNVLFKYTLVWIGSIILNTTGVYFVKNLLQSYTPLWDYSHSLCAMTAKVIVAVIVAFCWNYTMHCNFVYKHVNINNLFNRIND